MSPAWQTVLEIAGLGSALLFAALAGLVALMYLLTSPWLYAGPAALRAPIVGEEAVGPPLSDAGDQDAETARRRRAVAIAAAVALAAAERPAVETFETFETTSEWRRLHRTRRLGQPARRARART